MLPRFWWTLRHQMAQETDHDRFCLTPLMGQSLARKSTAPYMAPLNATHLHSISCVCFSNLCSSVLINGSLDLGGQSFASPNRVGSPCPMPFGSLESPYGCGPTDGPP